MLSKRQFLYLSVPGFAILCGILWFRRKKITVDCGCKTKNSCNTIDDQLKISNNQKIKFIRSQSLPITTNVQTAPIDIHPFQNVSKLNESTQIRINPPSKDRLHFDQINSQKLLEEQDFESISPVGLAGSADRKVFSLILNDSTIEDKPVVIKATLTSKVSPENSFVENKYTEVECTYNDNHQHNEGRDSANHSPLNVDISHNNISSLSDVNQNDENHLSGESNLQLSIGSHRSIDSGQGASPPRSEEDVGIMLASYEFLVPTSVIGQLIGRKRLHIKLIKEKSGANLFFKQYPDSQKLKICTIEGTQKEINDALRLIRKKLPEKKYPNLTLQRVFMTSPDSIIPIAAVDPSYIQLQLIEGINNDVCVSSIISGDHLFLQQPLHPSYPSLNTLQHCINQSYSVVDTPMLPEMVDNAICIAYIENKWFRVQIISHNSHTHTCLIKYLDFGGFSSITFSQLRQIRTDFMTLPFQSIECVLSNIKPIGVEWTQEAAEVLQQLTGGIILQAQVASYRSSDGLPEIFLYACLSANNVIFINKELVARKLAVWVDDSVTIQ